MIKPKTNSELPQIIAILASSLAGVFDGMLYAWTSPAIPQLVVDRTKNISLEDASYFTIISPAAMAITAPAFSFLIDAIGRRAGMLLIAIPAIISWLCIILSSNIWIYYTSRIFSGIVDAGTYAIVPVYVCEISQPRVRGTWGNVAAISIYIGMFLINVVGSYFTVKVAALICLSIPLMHFASFWFMPESPYYLMMKNKQEEARKSLQKLRGTNDVDDELSSLKVDVQRQLSETGTFRDLFLIISNRKALVMCMLIRLAQQLSGLAAFETYTQYMFKQAGKEISETTSAIVFTGFLALCIASSAYLVERFGRRPLLIISCFGCGIILGVISFYLYIHESTTINLANFTWVPLAGMSTYVVFFSPGIGLLPTLVLGELFSSSIKSKAVSVMNIITAVCFLIVPKFFQTMSYAYGIAVPFATFSLSCILVAILSYFYVIETKGKTLEEIQQELKVNKKHICKC